MKKLFKIVLLLSIIPICVAQIPKDKYFELIKNIEIFVTLYKEVNTYYVDDLNPSELMNTGIEAMLKKLDPYTNYIPEDDIENYQKSTTGEYAGIGALVKEIDGIHTVLMPYEGFSAERSDIKIGDQIIEINGIKTKGLNADDLNLLIKGQLQSEIMLLIKRPNLDAPFEVSLNREKIKVKNVPYFGMVGATVGYIKLEHFSTRAGQEVKSALLDLKKEGAEKIILDLRGNPGGLLSEAVNICNVFIPQNREVVTTRGKTQQWSNVYRTLDLPNDTDIPLAVLIDNLSASASEIVSGVVQDYDRGVVLGTKSYGKGLVQQTRPLVYNAQLKVTTAKYYIPSGRCIQALDYRNRNPDGSVGKVPDSLISEFKTQNGRSVFDGGGVDPDIIITSKPLAPVSQALLKNHLIFHFATQYFYKNDTLVSPLDFTISEALYEEFTQWVQSKKLTYDTKLEREIKKLKNTISTEENPILDEIEALEQKLELEKKDDLKEYKEEIMVMLKQDISSRYYFEKGFIESSFDSDTVLQAAISLLQDSDRYAAILNP